MFDITPLVIPGVPSSPEMLIVLLIAVLLFGANKIPKLARSTGEAMGEFKKGRQEVEQELQDMADPEMEEGDDDFVDTEPVTSEETATEE